MNTKANIFAGLLIAVGLLLLGTFVSGGLKGFKTEDRTVVVKGLAELEVPANKVIWPLTYNETGNELQQIYTTIESKNAAIIKFLTDSGIPGGEISCSAPVIVDLRADRYNQNPTPFRYTVTCVITVSTEKVDLVRELMIKQTALLKQGIAITGGNWEYRTEYMFTDINTVKPKMVEEATKNARATAEKFADDSKSKLGKIKSAAQGQLTITDRDANTPHIKSLRIVTTIEYMLED